MSDLPITLRTDLLAGGFGFPEAPRWHDGVLWFSDMASRCVRTVQLDGSSSVALHLQGDAPSGLGWTPDGDLLVVSMQHQRLLRARHGVVSTHARLAGLAIREVNDMVVDRHGGAYVGQFGFDPFGGQVRTSPMFRVTPEGTVSIAAEEMAFANGLVITPDGRTLIAAETMASRLTAFDIGANGELVHRRVFAQLPAGCMPDGICLDSAGAVWCACPMKGQVVRVESGGRITHVVEVRPGFEPLACALGGGDGRTLFVCTVDVLNIEEAARRMRGAIETVGLAAPGAGAL